MRCPRYVLVVAAVMGLAALPAVAQTSDGADAQRKSNRPSILLVTIDTLRTDRLGSYGGEDSLTPYLDSIARSGTRFERAFSPCPLTLPSHASMMTGLVPRRHGVRDNTRYRLDGSIPVLAELLREAGYTTIAFVSAAVLDRSLGLDRGFDIYDDNVRIGDRAAFNYQERAASQTTRAVLAGADDLTPPFFLWVHYYDPHLPYVPPEPFKTRFADRPYDGEIAYVDWELGGVLAEARRKDESLITIVVGDHGESLGDHGEDAHGVFLYQSTQHVPMIVAGDGIAEGRTVRRNVGLVDIAPTVLDLVNLPAMRRVDGRSLVPALRGGELDVIDYEMESLYPYFAYGWAPLRGLVRGSLKYIEAPRPELYDLTVDRSEMHDIAERWKAEGRALASTLEHLDDGLVPQPRDASDPELQEARRRIESLGYVGGSGGSDPSEATIDPKDGIAWLADLDAGRNALQRGYPAGGIAPLERLLERNPENFPAMLTLGQCHLATGNVERAIHMFRRAVELQPEEAIAHFNLANGFARKSAFDPAALSLAQAEYERALEINPRYAEVYLSYTLTLLTQGQGATAEAVLQRARRAGVRDPDIETEIGMLAVLREDVETARAAFGNAVVLNEHAVHALEGLGKITYAEEDFEAAADYYARALEAAPSRELAKTLGTILFFELDRPFSAKEAFEQAVELSRPDDPELEALQDLIELLEELTEDRVTAE